MPNPSNRAFFEADIDLASVDKALETVNRRIVGVVGSNSNLDKTLKTLEDTYKKNASALLNFAKAHVDASSSMGMVLEAGTQIGQGFAQGGPVGGAIAGATVLIDQMTKAWERELKAQNDAIDAQYRATDAMAKQQHSLDDQIAALKKQLAGPETAAQAWARNQALIEAAEEKRWAAVFANNKTEERFLDGEIRKLKEIQQLENARFTQQAKGPPAPKASAISTTKPLSSDDLYGAGGDFAASEKARDEDLANAQEWADKHAAIDREMKLAQVKASADAYADELRMVREHDKLVEEERQRSIDAQNASLAAGMATSIGIATSATQQYLDDLITGQDHATEHLIANISRQAGQALIGHGTDLAGQAVVSALTPGLQPLAAAQAAGAAGLITAGVALGGLATGIEHVAAGGQIGQALPAPRSPSSAAASRASGGGSAGGGSLTINVTNGLVAPAPQDQGRGINNAMKALGLSAGQSQITSGGKQGPSR